MVCCPPEIPKPHRLKRIIGKPGDFTLVESLCCFFWLETATFDHGDLDRAADKLASHRDTGSTSPDYAEVALDEMTVGEVSGVNEQVGIRIRESGRPVLVPSRKSCGA